MHTLGVRYAFYHIRHTHKPCTPSPMRINYTLLLEALCVNTIDTTWDRIHFFTCKNFGRKFCVQWPNKRKLAFVPSSNYSVPTEIIFLCARVCSVVWVRQRSPRDWNRRVRWVQWDRSSGSETEWEDTFCPNTSWMDRTESHPPHNPDQSDHPATRDHRCVCMRNIWFMTSM